MTIEFPHLLRLLEENQFDTIYHEHFSYFSLLSAEAIFAGHGLTIFDVEELWTHGGSLRIYARHAADEQPPGQRARARAARARGGGRLPRRGDVRPRSRSRSARQAQAARAADRRQARAARRIVGYGAPGKGNTLLNYCGIRTDFIDFTVDRNPYKQGRFLPGTHIPIHPPERIDEVKPDYILILPWNLKDEILAQLAHAREWGAQFIVPIPSRRSSDVRERGRERSRGALGWPRGWRTISSRARGFEGGRNVAVPRADMAYIGIVLGHGGDALQMLALAQGMRDAGVAVRVIVPELDSTVSFQQRCDTLGIDCTRSPLISASLEGARQNPSASPSCCARSTNRSSTSTRATPACPARHAQPDRPALPPLVRHGPEPVRDHRAGEPPRSYVGLAARRRLAAVGVSQRPRIDLPAPLRRPRGPRRDHPQLDRRAWG